jgi:hypothetical protein
VSPDTADKLYRYVRLLPSNKILNKKHTLFSTVSYSSSSQTKRMLVPESSQEKKQMNYSLIVTGPTM